MSKRISDLLNCGAGECPDLANWLRSVSNRDHARVFAELLSPEFQLHDGGIFFGRVDESTYRAWLRALKGDKAAVQKVLNHRHILEAFLGVDEEPNRSQVVGLVVGPNRFAFGLLKGNKLLDHKRASVRLYEIDGDRAQLERTYDAPYQPVESVVSADRVHRHADGSRHVHAASGAVRGLYISEVVFSRPGRWGVEIEIGEGAAVEVARTMLTVLDRSATPAVGAPAPRSHNLIARDVKDLRLLTTSEQPDGRLYQTRIADAIAQRKPQLIVFATPQFCTSRMCGPVLDVVKSLLPTYGRQVAFIHQEIWQDFAAKKAFPTVDEWRLDTEPWVYVVDGAGIIRAKFEGLVTAAELARALQGVVARR